MRHQDHQATHTMKVSSILAMTVSGVVKYDPPCAVTHKSHSSARRPNIAQAQRNTNWTYVLLIIHRYH